MAPDQYISRLGGREGYEVDSFDLEQRGGRSWCVLRLKARPGQRRCCSGCLCWCNLIHDVEPRRIRDLAIFEHRLELIVPRVRVACPHCGPKLELLGWLSSYSRVTRRLRDALAIVDIRVLDHLVVGGPNTMSMAERGLL